MKQRITVEAALGQRARLNRELTTANVLAQQLQDRPELEPELQERVLRVAENALLGARQYARLSEAIAHSNATTYIEIECD